MPNPRVPLAWSNLAGSKVKLAASLAGITFAVVLMFMELGFQNALLDGMVGLIEALDADLFIASRVTYSLGFKEPFPRLRIIEARNCPGVARVVPLSIEPNLGQWRNADDRSLRAIRVIAFRPSDRPFRDADLNHRARQLDGHDTALFDRWSRPGEIGAPAVGDRPRLAGRPIRIVGGFDLGADFINNGNLLMSERSYQNFFPDRRRRPELRTADLGLVRLRSDADPEPVRAELERRLPPDVEVFTRAGLIAREQTFWGEDTPAGFIFKMGMFMGFIVGSIICYQVLSSGIVALLAEYATLLAIGYRRTYLVGVVFQQAAYLAVLGFAAGLLIAAGLYAWVGHATRMPFQLRWERAALIFGLTAAMCLGSALLAIRKLGTADPVDLF